MRLWCFSAIVPVILVSSTALAAVDGFFERFRGTGPHNGFDNSGWKVVGDGFQSDMGYQIENFDPTPGADPLDSLSRTISGSGSFSNTLKLKDIDLGDVNDGFEGSGNLVITHWLTLNDRERANNQIIARLSESGNRPDTWFFQLRASGSDVVFFEIPRGNDSELNITYEEESSTVTATFDNDVSDQEPPFVLGPVTYRGTFVDGAELLLRVGSAGQGRGDAILASWSLLPISNILGDFNGNEVLDVGDIDRLAAEIRSGSDESIFDVNGDEVIDEMDREFWVKDLKSTFVGDSNLNGEFTSADLVLVFEADEYEDTIELNSGWAQGDWNGDGDFTSGDLVAAFQDGGYEQGPRIAAVVPEPSAIVLLMIGLLALTRSRKCAS